MTTRCEWCAHETAVARKCNGRVQCAMMAGYVEAQLRERLAYLCKDAATQHELQARIVACVSARVNHVDAFVGPTALSFPSENGGVSA